MRFLDTTIATTDAAHRAAAAVTIVTLEPVLGFATELVLELAEDPVLAAGLEEELELSVWLCDELPPEEELFTSSVPRNHDMLRCSRIESKRHCSYVILKVVKLLIESIVIL